MFRGRRLVISGLAVSPGMMGSPVWRRFGDAGLSWMLLLSGFLSARLASDPGRVLPFRSEIVQLNQLISARPEYPI